MKRITLIFTLIFVWYSNAQQGTSQVTVGNLITINSKVLNEERPIQVYLPRNYDEEKDRNFPVLYVLDGQEYFLNGIAYQDMLYFRDKSPAFIVVGLNSDRRKRRQLYYPDSAKFIDFLKDEVIPFIDNNYRTKKHKERMFFGWEMAGGLGLEIMSSERDLFSGYFIASPTHSTEKRIKALEHYFNQNLDHPFLFITSAPEEHWINEDSTFLSTIHKNKRTRFSTLEREDHYTTPLKTIHEGLSDYFSDYKPIRLRSTQAYDDYGGLEALRVYYKKRGERYDLPQDIHSETKHFLIYNTMTEDDYERFSLYINEFPNYFNTMSRDFWINRYADFYLKFDNNEKAIALLKFGIQKFPESTLLLERLGDYYLSKKDNNNAKIYFNKALVLNSELNSVKEKLKSLD